MNVDDFFKQAREDFKKEVKFSQQDGRTEDDEKEDRIAACMERLLSSALCGDAADGAKLVEACTELQTSLLQFSNRKQRRLLLRQCDVVLESIRDFRFSKEEQRLQGDVGDNAVPSDARPIFAVVLAAEALEEMIDETRN